MANDKRGSTWAKTTSTIKRYDRLGNVVPVKTRSWQEVTHPLDGRPSPIKELTASNQRVLAYARGLHAEAVVDHKEEIHDDTFRNLAVGTKSMEYTRGQLSHGRGNVDANTKPEALIRTGLGIKYFQQHLKTKEYAKFAGGAELVRAGNCDSHASVNYTFSSALMADKSIAAKVSYPGHTFTELRSENGKTQLSPKDVIVDSWTGGDHAVLRQDSTFATTMSESKVPSKVKPYTQETIDNATGRQNWLKKQKFKKLPENVKIESLVNKIAPKDKYQFNFSNEKQYKESPIMSTQGTLASIQRESTFEKGDNLLREIMTVHTARKLGASIGGAAKYAKENL